MARLIIIVACILAMPIALLLPFFGISRNFLKDMSIIVWCYSLRSKDRIMNLEFLESELYQLKKERDEKYILLSPAKNLKQAKRNKKLGLFYSNRITTIQQKINVLSAITK